MIADDFFDGDAAFRRHADRFSGDLRLFGVIDRERERMLHRLHAEEIGAAFFADVGEIAVAVRIDDARANEEIARQRDDGRRFVVAARHDDRAQIFAAHELQNGHLDAISFRIENGRLRRRVIRPVAGKRLIEVRERCVVGDVGGLRQDRQCRAVRERFRQIERNVRRLRIDERVDLLGRVIFGEPLRSGGDIRPFHDERIKVCAGAVIVELR